MHSILPHSLPLASVAQWANKLMRRPLFTGQRSQQSQRTNEPLIHASAIVKDMWHLCSSCTALESRICVQNFVMSVDIILWPALYGSAAGLCV